MFDVLIIATPKPALPGSASLRKLVRGALECWSSGIRSARLTVQPSPGIDPQAQVDYLCCLRLDLAARAPLRVVASAAAPHAAITLVLRRAQALLQARVGRSTASNRSARSQPTPGADIAA